MNIVNFNNQLWKIASDLDVGRETAVNNIIKLNPDVRRIDTNKLSILERAKEQIADAYAVLLKAENGVNNEEFVFNIGEGLIRLNDFIRVRKG